MMPSEVSKIKVKSEESISVLSHQQVKSSSIQHHFSRPSKDKNLYAKGSQNIDLLDKVGVLRTRKLHEQSGPERNMLYEKSRVDCNGMKGRYEKPWPGKKLNGDDELVKHMSHLPCYLRRGEKEDNIQEKALNFGVLDWGLLERWAYHQKCTANGDHGQSKSSISESSSFSTSGSADNLSRSKHPPGKMYPSRYPCRKPIIICNATQLKEKENRGDVAGSDSKTSLTNVCNRHAKHCNSDCHLSTERSEHKHDKGDRENSEKRNMRSKAIMPPYSVNLQSTLEEDIDPSLRSNSVEAQDGRLKKTDRMQDYHCSLNLAGHEPKSSENSKFMEDHIRDSNVVKHVKEDGRLKKTDQMQDYHHRLSLANDVLNPLENRKCRQDHVQKNGEENHIRFGSSWKGSWLIEGNDNYFADNFFDVVDSRQSPDVPHSCPLPQNIVSNEPDMGNTLLSYSLLPTKKPTCRSSNHNQFSSWEKNLVYKTQEPPQCEAKATNAGGEPSNIKPSAALKWMSRSSSLKESFIEGELKPSAGPDKLEGDKEAKSNKGRQSPLRRMLDLLSKPKGHGQVAASPGRHSYEPSKSDKSLIWQELGSTYGLHKSSNTNIDSICQANVNMNMAIEKSNNCRRTLQVEKHATSQRQALLQLAWKNGLPLFMLSSSDNDVLAATVAPKHTSSKDNLECIYTIFSVNESKKKKMLWGNPGNKGKNHQLVSSVVGQIKVSTSQLRSNEFSNHHVVREFVLLGNELVPKSVECVDFPLKSELAAIVINVSQERPISSAVGILSSSNCRDSFLVNSAKNSTFCDEGKCLQTNQKSDSASGISVVIPNAVHGSSTDAEPSPLIQRWRSGGICDCGGWDEGCMLTILEDKSRACSFYDSFQVHQTMDGTQRLELFIQGQPREKRPAFSIVSLKEGVYTIDFRSSIALLQAFAICIATLHARKPDKSLGEIKSLHANLVNHRAITTPGRTRRGDATSYVPNCPPLSPVARA